MDYANQPANARIVAGGNQNSTRGRNGAIDYDDQPFNDYGNELAANPQNNYNPLHTGYGNPNSNQGLYDGYNNSSGRYDRPSVAVNNRAGGPGYRGTIGNARVTPLNFNYS